MAEFTIHPKYMRKVTLNSLHKLKTFQSHLLNPHFHLVGEFLPQS